MNRWLVAFCRLALQLDRIPRYGRYYTIPADRLRELRSAGENWLDHMQVHWSWQRNGRWGMNLLVDLKLFWRYLDHLDPEWDPHDPEANADEPEESAAVDPSDEAGPAGSAAQDRSTA